MIINNSNNLVLAQEWNLPSVSNNKIIEFIFKFWIFRNYKILGFSIIQIIRINKMKFKLLKLTHFNFNVKFIALHRYFPLKIFLWISVWKLFNFSANFSEIIIVHFTIFRDGLLWIKKSHPCHKISYYQCITLEMYEDLWFHSNFISPFQKRNNFFSEFVNKMA